MKRPSFPRPAPGPDCVRGRSWLRPEAGARLDGSEGRHRRHDKSGAQLECHRHLVQYRCQVHAARLFGRAGKLRHAVHAVLGARHDYQDPHEDAGGADQHRDLDYRVAQERVEHRACLHDHLGIVGQVRATGSVSFAAGDYVSLIITPANTPSTTVSSISAVFVPTTANDTIMTGRAASFSTSSTYVGLPFSDQSPSIVSSRALAFVPDGGTVDQLYVLSTAPGSTGQTSKKYDWAISKNATTQSTFCARSRRIRRLVTTRRTRSASPDLPAQRAGTTSRSRRRPRAPRPRRRRCSARAIARPRRAASR